MIEKLMAMDAALVAAGWPSLSDWWAESFRRMSDRNVRRWVIRKGRRAGGSSSLCRLAVAVALWGKYSIPPGDVGVVAFVSVSRDEAASRLRTIIAILKALGVAHTPRGDTIELHDRPVVFKTFTASIAGVSGFTSILVVLDEVAKWKDSDTGSNPAKEVIASIAPTMATQPTAFMVMSSSPFSTLDAHHDAYTRGETDDQTVAFGPTWIANPTLTEEQTHALEPDIETWRREYAAEPMGANGVSFFDPDAVDGAVEAGLVMPMGVPVDAMVGCGVDPAFKRDAAAAAYVAMRDGIVTLLDLAEVRPSPGSPLQPSVVCAAFASKAKALGCASMTTDGHYVESVRESVTRFGLRLREIPAGIVGKTCVYTRARELFNTSKIRLPGNAPALVRSLKEIVSRPTSNGQMTITAPRRLGNHGDTVSALVAAIWDLRASVGLPSTHLPDFRETDRARRNRIADAGGFQGWTRMDER